MTSHELRILNEKLDLLIAAISKLGPKEMAPPHFDDAECFVWTPESQMINPVPRVNRLDISLIRGVERPKEVLLENTRRFAAGFPANNVLLWGARGMGKSSLVKAAHATINKDCKGLLKLIEIHREDIDTLPSLLGQIRDTRFRFILYCDDLSFDHDDTSYKSLKAALEGGVEGRPENALFYATSNRRHLLPRDMIENERSTAINPSEAVEEKVSLSDRFGLWLGFHKCDQDAFLEMVAAYADHYEIPVEHAELNALALEWAATRGSRSGRVAFQFIQDLAGRSGIHTSS